MKRFVVSLFFCFISQVLWAGHPGEKAAALAPARDLDKELDAFVEPLKAYSSHFRMASIANVLPLDKNIFLRKNDITKKWELIEIKADAAGQVQKPMASPITEKNFADIKETLAWMVFKGPFESSRNYSDGAEGRVNINQSYLYQGGSDENRDDELRKHFVKTYNGWIESVASKELGDQYRQYLLVK